MKYKFIQHTMKENPMFMKSLLELWGVNTTNI